MTLYWTRQIRWAAVGGAVALALLAGFAPGAARAEDDGNGDSIWNWDKKIMDGMMKGLGLKNGTEDTIEYRERSPLVVPPSRDLPPPQSSVTARDPNWPTDADVQRRQATKTKTRKDPTYDPEVTFGKNLRPSQLGGSTGSVATTSGAQGDNAQTGNAMEDSVKPSRLGYKGGLFGTLFKSSSDDETGSFTGEPPRTSLTEPPPGYQTPSPAQPYGVTKRIEYGKAIKAEDIAAGNIDGK
jgi:hypothetical protein